MNDRKFFSIFLGVGNIILLTLLSTLFIKLFGEMLILTNILMFLLVSLILTFVINTFFYHKLYSDTDLNESILYSLLTSICWFVVLFIILELGGLKLNEYNVVLKIIILIEYIINYFSIFLLNIIFIIKPFKYDKKIMNLIIGIIAHILIPIFFIIFCYSISTAFYLNNYTEKEILNVLDKKENISNGVIIENSNFDIDIVCDFDCEIIIDNYLFKYDGVYIRSSKGAKIYKIKVDNKIYIVGVYIGSSGIIPKRQYKILDEIFI